MEAQLSTAFSLLIIGMVTVFIVLTLVVGMGNLLIRLVNLMPEPMTGTRKDEIAPQTVAVITAAVQTYTGGKGTIKSIEQKS